MRPVLIGAQAAPGGRLALTFSLTPGRRVTIIGPDTGDIETTAADIAAAVLPVIERTLAPESRTA